MKIIEEDIMTALKNIAIALISEEEGQGMVEYALILALVSVVAIATLTTMGGNVNTVFTNATTALKIN
jgi:pilus assembly protein Flp/PilA